MESSLRIAIIDLECTCNNFPAFGVEDYEVIEIGAVSCDFSSEGLMILDSFQIYVQPTTRPILTDFCTQLTGIEQRTVDQAKVLGDALSDLHEWLVKNEICAWASWGNDSSIFVIECRLKLLENPLSHLKHFDVKRIFTQKFGQRAGMKRAMQFFGIVPEGRAHSGIDDAKNVAKILANEEVLRNAIFSSLRKS